MNKPDNIVIHCSATRVTMDVSIDNIKAMHLARGFNDVGYHFYIRKNGAIEYGRKLWVVGAHVKGKNTGSIGVCYEGGLDAAGNPADTRTPQQKAALEKLIRALMLTHQIDQDKIVGHRDHSPDLDGDGLIERHEWIKECPCFDVREWLDSILNC